MNLSINNYSTFVVDEVDEELYPDLTEEEKNLVATITSVLIEPNNQSIRLPDISISVPSDEPTGKKIRRIISSFKKNSHGTFDLI
jgi:hypothetical protein